MTQPVRIQLSRAKGFNLQEVSLAINGLPAVKVTRPGVFGNPFTIQQAADVFDCRTESAHAYAVGWFKEWMECINFEPMGPWEGFEESHARLKARLPELRGKNLACFCKHDFECHADVLLEIANRPICEEVK